MDVISAKPVRAIGWSIMQRRDENNAAQYVETHEKEGTIKGNHTGTVYVNATSAFQCPSHCPVSA
jgi:hypothetical protein